MWMAIVSIKVDTDLIEKARINLGLDKQTVPTAVVRKALIDAAGDDAMEMSHVVKLGRPFSRRSI